MELDWKNLGFKYIPTNGYVMTRFKNGDWSVPEFIPEQSLDISIAANCLHYGQACFEGLKAFSQPDGRVVLFRPQKNWERLRSTTERVCMVTPPEKLFLECCEMAIQNNQEFVPPHGTGASLYVRPLLIGTQPTIGLAPSDEYLLLVMVTPVGPYYKDGFHPVKAVVIDNYDRAATQGTGQAKVAGNYAAGFKPGLLGKDMGYPIVLFTDPKEHKYVDEFGTSNFIGITENKEYVTPQSPSILNSITNQSLQILAADMGFNIKVQPIALDSLGQFSEVGACGTAAVITPISAIVRGEQQWTFGGEEQAGPVLTELYNILTSIQNGESGDKHNWLHAVI